MLMYVKDKNGVLIEDEFMIDLYMFFVIWYVFDDYEVVDMKEIVYK